MMTKTADWISRLYQEGVKCIDILEKSYFVFTLFSLCFGRRRVSSRIFPLANVDLEMGSLFK